MLGLRPVRNRAISLICLSFVSGAVTADSCCAARAGRQREWSKLPQSE